MTAPVYVIATTPAGTREAVAAASVVAGASGASVYVLSGHNRPAPSDLKASEGVTDIACVYSDASDLLALIPRGARVFIGGDSGRWWPSPELRLARRLASLGCHAVFRPCLP